MTNLLDNQASVPLLNGSNYHIWSIKIEAVLSLRGLLDILEQVEPKPESEDYSSWSTKNAKAVSIIKLSLSDQYVLQYGMEKKAKELLDRIKIDCTGGIEDRKIDASQEVKNLQMLDMETANDYIARAKGLVTKCASLGLTISNRELVFYIVRGLNGKFSRVREILKTQRDKSLEDILEILREEELTMMRANPKCDQAFVARKLEKVCSFCSKKGHVWKTCYKRLNQQKYSPTPKNQRRSSSAVDNRRWTSNSNSAMTVRSDDSPASQSSEVDSDIWIIDSGASSHMVIKDKKSKLLNERSEIHKSKRKAFMDLLLQHNIDSKTMSEADVREEVDTFVFEGHDTTAMGICWALYLMGLYKDIQSKVHEELDRIFGSDTERHVCIEDLKEMEYLDRVLKETLRLYPPVPLIARQLNGKETICGYPLPKGATCIVLAYYLHRDPEVFPNPEKFDSDRFLPENSINRSPYAYIPFSAGPRNCIGQRYAVMEMKTVVSTILRNFELTSLDERDKVPADASLTLGSPEPVRIKFQTRNNN